MRAIRRRCVVVRIAAVNNALDKVGDLVHRSVGRQDTRFVAHRWFIGTRLTIGVLGLVLMGLCFSMPGSLSRSTLLASTDLGFQAVIAMMVSRFGGLRMGYLLSTATLCALPVVATGAMGAGAMVPLVLEGAILTGSAGAAMATGMMVLAALLAFGLAGNKGDGVLLASQIVAIATMLGGAHYLVKRDRDSEAQARFADDRWRALSGLADRGVVRHDAQGHVVGSNAAFCRAIGINPMELEDSTVITRLHLGSGPAFLKALSDVSHGATIAEARVRIKCEPEAEGHHGPDPYRDFMLRVACAVTDPATQQREILAYYTPVNAAAELPSAAHPSALATARLGHELRTPLTAIIGFADCLGDPAIIAADDPKRGDYARIIGTSARHMLDVVNGMAGIAHPQPSAEIISSASDAIDLAELIDESVSIMRLNVEAQRASLHWIVEADVPVLIGCRHAFRQILINLISNALKFAPEGSVLVRASRDGTKVRLTVEDNGMGVAGEDLARLGEPFFRGRLAGENGPDGQGLGLGIVRDIVRDHHGDFDVMSRPGAGTRVIVTFAIPDAISALKPTPIAARIPERRYA